MAINGVMVTALLKREKWTEGNHSTAETAANLSYLLL